MKLKICCLGYADVQVYKTEIHAVSSLITLAYRFGRERT